MNERYHEGDEPVQHSRPDLTCYGCGPANRHGLQPKSYLAPDEDGLVARIVPEERFTSGSPNVMYGGHIASLLDCHPILTAITITYLDEGRPLGSDPRITYATGRLCVDYHDPTPFDRAVRMRAWIDGDVTRGTTVRSALGPIGETTATGEVIAVRVDPPDPSGHHRASGRGPCEQPSDG